MSNFLCRILGHRRSAARAYRSADGWRSNCKRCGSPLIRVAPMRWEEPASIDEAA